MAKSKSLKRFDLFKEDIPTIVIVLTLVLYDYIKKEWPSFRKGSLIKVPPNPHGE